VNAQGDIVNIHYFPALGPNRSVLAHDGVRIVSGDRREFSTKKISDHDIWETIYGKTWPVLWGHYEYKDIFGTKYSENYCFVIAFYLSNGAVSTASAAALNAQCTLSTIQNAGTGKELP
jgi:hypothetical protein